MTQQPAVVEGQKLLARLRVSGSRYRLQSKAVLVVLSGGQDSTTCLAWAKKEKSADATLKALTVSYGQRHSAEIDAASTVAFHANVPHEVLMLPRETLHGTSPLVSSAHQVERYGSANDLPGGLEKTFVPMRNMLFLTLAANRAVELALQTGARSVDIVLGVSQEDYGGYPDCREEFIGAAELAISEALSAPELVRITLVTPLLHLTKRQTVQLAVALPYAMHMLQFSHTCYEGSVPPCGHCHACLLRAKGFAEAGVPDPLIERLGDDH